MDFKTEYKRLIEIVREKREKNNISTRNEDFASMLGYNRSYFSTLLGEKGKVTAEHIKILVFHFDWLKKYMSKQILNAIQNVGDSNTQLDEGNSSDLDALPTLNQQYLEKSIENLTQNELRTTAIIERLVTLLENKFGSAYDPSLPRKGEPGTETGNKKASSKKAG